jgi:putative peptidoglycan lipid II flippase
MSHISRSTLIIAFFFGVDKVLALARQILMGRLYTTDELDVFLAANNVPDLLSSLISGGALGVALIPVLSEYLEKRSRADAWELFARIINLAFVVTGILAGLIFLFAEPLIARLIVPGFSPEKQALAVELMRLDLAAIMIFAVSGLAMAGLQANQHFLLPALAPALYNAGQIFGIAYFSPGSGVPLGPVTLSGLGLGIHGLVYGVILGAGLHLAVQVPGLIKYGFRWRAILGLRTPGVAQVLRLLAPRVLTMACLQWFFLLRDNLASRLGDGAVTGLNYGWFIMQVPETLIGTALAVAILPTLAGHIARGDEEAFRGALTRGVRVLLALTVPIAAALALGVEPLVGILGLAPEVAHYTVLATRAYLLGLTGHALLEIASRSFYARQDARTPFLAALLHAVIIYSALSYWFTGWWGITGIALANTIAFTTEAILLFALLSRKTPGIWQVGGTVWRVALGSALAAAVTAAGQALLPFDQWGTAAGAAAGAGILAAGLAAAVPFILPEIRQMMKM